MKSTTKGKEVKMETKTIEEIVKVLKDKSWNVNNDRPGVKPLLIIYPNEVLLGLFGEELMERYWISDDSLDTK